MTSLIDRYVYTALRRVPEQQRGDIDQELRASIEDAVDARVEAGEERDAAVETTLTELGDPDKLADQYAGRTNVLIGPEIYPAWRRLLTLLLAAVLPIVVIIGVVIQLVDDPDVGKVIGGAITSILTVGTQMAFWTTAVFAVIERTGAGRNDIKLNWTLKDLPKYEPSTIPKTEVGAGIVWPALLITALVWQQFGLSEVPVLDPANWSFWWPYMIGALVLGAGYQVWLYRRRKYDRTVSVVNAVQQLISAVPLIWLLSTDHFFNPEFHNFADLGDGDVKQWLTAIVIAILALGTAYDIFKVIVRGEQALRGRPAKVPGTGNYNFGS
ncbi:permease prefix domain 1-containing protein [Actinoplanes sp. NPDC026619]|uniref:permease prefix domain 1-containing protein n=1 Tax=Actinoplanes sp. NPDC026619 TaxID=3155798 RepID=UPI0034018C2F